MFLIIETIPLINKQIPIIMKINRTINKIGNSSSKRSSSSKISKSGISGIRTNKSPITIKIISLIIFALNIFFD